jgi:molecular chaperone GrpE
VTDKELVEEGTEKVEEEVPAAEALTEVEAAAGELAEARKLADEYLDGWQRARAELANYKKRVEQNQENARQMATVSLLSKLLPVLDDFELAFQAVPPEMAEEVWVEGINLVRRKLRLIVEQEGVTPIATEGQTFDPTYHEAVTYEEMEGYEEGQIIAEVQKGYKIGEWVLRPAQVRVAK